MFLKISNMLFLMMIVFSTVISVSSGSWLLAWVALEINLMAIIPLLLNKLSFGSTSSTIKYFLVQAMASILIVSSFIVFFLFNYSMSISISSEMMAMAMVMKLGTPPFQFWLPQVISSAGPMQTILILSWQKVSPFNFITYTNSQLMTFYITISAVIGSLGGLNQNSLYKIMAYSSMSHAAWMITAMLISEKAWMTYFTIYSVVLITFFLFMYSSMEKKISNFAEKTMNTTTKMLFSLSLLSMGGLPPFLGFLGKMIILQVILMNKELMLTMVLLTSSFISLLFYLRMSYMIIMQSGNEMKTMKENNKKSSVMLWVVLLMNSVIPLLTLIV